MDASVKAAWEADMITYGHQACERLQDPTLTDDQRLTQVFYDSQYVFYQVGDYVHDPYFYNCAEIASAIYRDSYAIPNGCSTPGYWNFTDGLAQDYLRNGDELSRQTAINISQQAAYARDGTPLEWTVDSTLSREVAYTITSYLNAEDLGEARRDRLAPLVDQALGHMEQWFVLQNAPWVRPFMAGLTFHSLITYFERTGDPRIIPAMEQGADWLWDHTWLPAAQAFSYTDRIVNPGDLDPAPDLSLLIAPAFAFLYHQTGEPRFLERGDQIFAGGVAGAFLANGKQYNQNYKYSFEYMRLRALPPLRQP